MLEFVLTMFVFWCVVAWWQTGSPLAGFFLLPSMLSDAWGFLRGRRA